MGVAPVAAATFAIGWYLLWNIPARSDGGRVCGAAGAGLMLGLLIFTPLNAAIALVLAAKRRSDREDASSDPPATASWNDDYPLQ